MTVATRMGDLSVALPSDLERAWAGARQEWQQARGTARLWQRDASLWTGSGEDSWLGWLDLPREPTPSLARLDELARETSDELRHVMLLGMGGSSLGAAALGHILDHDPGSPRLHMLDSTEPDAIVAAENEIELHRTLFLTASKSGGTLETALLADYFLQRLGDELGAAEAGRRFIAITDAGSVLERRAGELGFRHTLRGRSDVGGRFSILSPFGLVPAAVAGIPVGPLLARGREMADLCRETAIEANPGALLGTLLAAAARCGRIYVPLVLSPSLLPFGAWIEQLVAESTGKNGTGLLPLVGESLAPPDRYGADRLFLALQLEGEEADPRLDPLRRAGHAVGRFGLDRRDAVGAEIVRWQVATAVAGALLDVNPFDQPDVEASKEVTRCLLEELAASEPGAAEEALVVGEEGSSEGVVESLADVLRRLRPGGYFALLAYLDPSCAAVLERLRLRVRDHARVATSLGFGPRYLHSTGQFFKGGPAGGVFVVVTAEAAHRLEVPGRPYAFGDVARAQARGDAEVLRRRRRPVLRVHLTGRRDKALEALERLLAEALGRARISRSG